MNNTSKLFEIFSHLFEVDPSELSDESSSDTIPKWDSLGMVNLVVELEQVFDVQFDLLEIADFKNIAIIKSILAAKGVPFDMDVTNKFEHG